MAPEDIMDPPEGSQAASTLGMRRSWDGQNRLVKVKSKRSASYREALEDGMMTDNPPKRLREESKGVARGGTRWKVKIAAEAAFRVDPEVLDGEYLGQTTKAQVAMEGSRKRRYDEVQGVQEEQRRMKTQSPMLTSDDSKHGKREAQEG